METVKKENEVDGLSTVAIKTIELLIMEKDTYDENIYPEPCHCDTTVEQDEAAEIADENVDNLIQEVKGVCEHMQRHLKVVKILIDKLLQVRVDYEQGTEEDKITAHEKTDKYIAQLDYIISELL